MKNKRKKGIHKNPEVVILSRVKDLGPGKETSKLKPGFVKYLISKGACVYKKGNEEMVQNRMQILNEEDSKRTTEAQQNMDKMKNLVITIKRESGTGGSLYGSVSATDICKELQKVGINIQKADIDLNTIKALGEYSVQVRLYGGLKVKLGVNVAAMNS